MSICRLGTLSTAPLFFLFCAAAALPSIAQADTDACTVLTPAQVGAAVGVPVAAGTHVTPTFVKTCTWTRVRQLQGEGRDALPANGRGV